MSTGVQGWGRQAITWRPGPAYRLRIGIIFFKQKGRVGNRDFRWPESPKRILLTGFYKKSVLLGPCPGLLPAQCLWGYISSVQFSRTVVSDSLLPHESQYARPPCPSLTPGVHSDSRPSSQDAIQPSHPLSSPSPPAPNPSQHQNFSSEWTLRMRWPKYWNFSFSIIPSKEIPGLISFRMDWLDVLAVQGTLKSLLQHHSSKASMLRRSAFFTVQLSHPYMTTGKTVATARQTLVSKVMSLL